MTTGQPVTETQKRFSRTVQLRRWLFVLLLLILFAGVLTLGTAVAGFFMFQRTFGVTYLDNMEKNFKHGSIGAELANGLPYRLFMGLPKIFPEYFGETGDYREFGFLYEKEDGTPYGKSEKMKGSQLPVGFAKGVRRSVEVAWFNCAVCHVGLVKEPGSKTEKIIVGMPANTVKLEKFFLALFRMVVDKDFSWGSKKFREEIDRQGRPLNFVEKFLWEWAVMPQTREVLLDRRNRLLPLLRPQAASESNIRKTPECRVELAPKLGCPELIKLSSSSEPSYKSSRPTQTTHWGPGRVDTFNPYKLIHFDIDADCLSANERVGVADFPSVFLQKPRGDQQMHLHWDGNNSSLKERNLSAALGAGVTEDTVIHESVEAIATWLGGLKPPKSPYLDKLDPQKLARGKGLYMSYCADCHGYQDKDGYVFKGPRLGKIEPIDYVATDPRRLMSYTHKMEKYQKERLFCRRREHRFRYFKKTNGYANQPLDGLWVRAPYLHNGSVPTLKDLLDQPKDRPKAYIRGLVELDAEKGGFKAPACESVNFAGPGFCFDTARDGNGNQGHLYGTELTPEEKQDLLTYLLSF